MAFLNSPCAEVLCLPQTLIRCARGLDLRRMRAAEQIEISACLHAIYTYNELLYSKGNSSVYMSMPLSLFVTYTTKRKIDS